MSNVTSDRTAQALPLPGSTLHPLVWADKHDRPSQKRWCGPSALAIVTGLTYDDAYAQASKALRRKRIVGMSCHEMRLAFARAGWNMGLNTLEGGMPRRDRRSYYRMMGLQEAKLPPPTTAMTLAKWLETRTLGQQMTTFLVNVGRHWIVVRGTKMADNHTREPVPVDTCPHRRKRVYGTYALIQR